MDTPSQLQYVALPVTHRSVLRVLPTGMAATGTAGGRQATHGVGVCWEEEKSHWCCCALICCGFQEEFTRH